METNEQVTNNTAEGAARSEHEGVEPPKLYGRRCDGRRQPGDSERVCTNTFGASSGPGRR